MATEPQTGLTYRDLQSFPEDNLRREIIDGELIVTAAPGGRHQDVVLEFGARLLTHTREHGGKVSVAPRDVYLADDTVVEPDVVFVRPENVSRIEERFVRRAPDVVVEVSSASTRRLELVRKLEAYERFRHPRVLVRRPRGRRIELYRLREGRYDPPTILSRDDELRSPLVPGFSVAVADLLLQAPPDPR